MRCICALVLLGIAWSAGLVSAEIPPAWGGKARHIIIAVIDGPRWSESWGDPLRANIPHQAKELLPQGTLYTNFRNSGWTYTTCGHTALTTGFYEKLDNTGKELPGHPSVFQYFRAATRAPATQTWVITSKDKLFTLANTTDPAWHGILQPSVNCGVPARGPLGGMRDDPATMVVVQEVLRVHHPALMLINFREPDSSGHAKNWEAYLQGIRDTDGYVAALWTQIQSDPELKDRTNLFITNDHGRHPDGHSDGYVSHGDDCAGCRHIALLALGPDIAPGRVLTVERNQTDLAVTVAHLAGVTLEGATGVLMTELLEPAGQVMVPASALSP